MSDKQTEWIENELPAPVDDAEFIQLANDLLAQVESLGAEAMAAPWTPVSQNVTGVTCMEKHGIKDLEGTPLTLLKAVGNVQGLSPLDILNMSLELDVSKRKAYDGDLVSLKLIKEISPTVQVTLSEVNCPFPVTNREFCDLRTWKVEDGGDRVVFGSRSVNISNNGNPDLIRGKAFNGVLLRKLVDEEGLATRMVFIGYVDPKGWVPLAIINAFKGKITEKYDLYRKIASGRSPRAKKKRHQRSQSAVSPTFPSDGEIALLADSKRTKKSRHRRSRSSAHEFRSHREELKVLSKSQRGGVTPLKKDKEKKSHRRSLSSKFKISPRREMNLSRSSARAERRSRTVSPVNHADVSQHESELKSMRVAIERLQLQQERNQWWSTRAVSVLIALLVLSLAVNLVN